MINRIGDFEAGITSLQNPTFLSQIFALSGIEKIHQAYSFWKWGALILALVASFTTIVNRIKILIVRIQNHHLIASPPLLSKQEDYDYDSETDTSCSSSLSEDEDEDSEQPASSSHSWRSIDEDFSVRSSGHHIDDRRQNGNFMLRRLPNSSIGDLFSWPELTNGKNVVKLWDNLGLGLELNLNYNKSRNVISVFDMNNDQNICSIFGGKHEATAVSTSSSSPAVLLTSEANVLRVWDTRVGRRIPEILAEWKPKLGKIVGVNGGGRSCIDKVYVRDDVTGSLTVGDLRKVSSPLVNVTETDVDTWWDADAVFVTDESG